MSQLSLLFVLLDNALRDTFDTTMLFACIVMHTHEVRLSYKHRAHYLVGLQALHS